MKLSEWERAEFYELYTDQKGISHRNVITVRGNNGASPSRAVAYGSKLDDVLIKSKVQRCIYIAQCIKKELWVMPSGKQADSYRAYIACMRAAFNRSVKAVFPKMRSILSFQSCRLSFMNDLVNAGYGHHEIAEICGATRGELKCIENIRNDVSSRKEIYCINSKYD